MLSFNFQRLFLVKGVKYPVAWLMNRGFSDKFASAVAHNRHKRMSLSDVERLCNVFQCTPNDLMEWTPDAKDTDVLNHCMAPLLRRDKVLDLTKTLNSVSLDKLLEIEKIIQQEINKA